MIYFDGDGDGNGTGYGNGYGTGDGYGNGYGHNIWKFCVTCIVFISGSR